MAVKPQNNVSKVARRASAVQRKDHARRGFTVWLVRFGIVLLLLIPTYLAIGSYFYIQNRSVTVVETYYTAFDVTGPGGASVCRFDDIESIEEKAALLTLFTTLTERKTPASALPETHQNNVYHIVLYTNTGTSERYRLYCNAASSAVYCVDEAGKIWYTPAESAQEFLNSAYAYELYGASTLPVLTTAATDEVIPTSLSWHYRTQKGTFARRTQIATTAERLIYPIANDIQFYFSVEPSDCEVVIRRGENELYRGKKDGISLSELRQDEVLDFEITASYNLASDSAYYGSAFYAFRMKVVEAASFSLGTLTPTAGDYVLLSCRNVRNVPKLQIESTPALAGKPVVFERNGMAFAAIPTVSAGNYHFTVTYGTISAGFDLTVGEQTGTSVLSPDAETLRGNWQRLLGGDLDALIASYGAEIDYARLTPVAPLASLSDVATVGYGDTVTIASVPFAAEFEYYRMSGSVAALSAGVVRKVGVDEALGNYVVLDHGCGIYTWYGDLSEVRVREGNFIAPGDILGLAGRSGAGFADSDGCILLVTIGKSSVSPAFLRENALVLPAQ